MCKQIVLKYKTRSTDLLAVETPYINLFITTLFEENLKEKTN